MRFTGTLDELKEKLEVIANDGEWKELNKNQVQFKHINKGLLNWYPDSGGVHFQGKEPGLSDLKSMVERLLSDLSIEAEIENSLSTGPTSNLKEAIDVGESDDNLSENQINLLNNTYSDSELIIGLVGAVGTELDGITKIISDRLKNFNYDTEIVKVSSDVISEIGTVGKSKNEYGRISALMNEGNRLRETAKDNSILSMAIAAKINEIRSKSSSDGQVVPLPRKAIIIDSLKHPREVQRLRDIYTNGFFLMGIYTDEKQRFEYLTKELKMAGDEAQDLIKRDDNEAEDYGQHTRDTFHLSDFFLSYGHDHDKCKKEVWRILDLIFGKPYITPTFDEFAMFMAFSSSLRSADLSRQVGAVVAKDKNIVATGANDVPKAFGGLYWPEFDVDSNSIVDSADGRDYMREFDSNAFEKKRIIEEIIAKVPDEHKNEFQTYLEESGIKDITEYGRVVHAEMEALLACARNSIGTLEGTMYCTTFPCHNCAKHIIASGIKRVVYVEPFPKSKAFQFHSDSITSNKSVKENVLFEPFVGVGARRFISLFSMNLGNGYPITRKKKDGTVVEWDESQGSLRMQMLPISYLERENLAASLVKQFKEKIDE